MILSTEKLNNGYHYLYVCMYVSGGFCHLKRSWLIFVLLRGTNMDIDSHISNETPLFLAVKVYFMMYFEK